MDQAVLHKKTTLNCRGKVLDLSLPKIMGILNITPDSFYDGGRYTGEKEMLAHAEQMLQEGADMIDVGGVSTRPKAAAVDEKDELRRLLPVVKSLTKQFPDAILSVDTYRAQVAEAAIGEGASVINDISAGAFDDRLFETVARLRVPYILMHIQGVPGTMQDDPQYEDVTREVMEFFIAKLSRLKTLGINDVVLDPGFGFGKGLEHNYTLLNRLGDFKIFGLPVMVGISRKSMVCKALKVNPDKALNGTTALHSLALVNGANILRVHDVKEAKEVIQLARLFMHAGRQSP